METKVLLLTPYNLGPYHRARYQLLAQGEIELVIAKMPLKEYYRPWQAGDVDVNFRVITPFDGKAGLQTLLISATELLKNEKPDVVVCVGYYGRYILATSLACKFAGVPCSLYLVGWNNENTRNPIKEKFKHLYVKSLFTAALATGKHAGRYANSLGISSEKTFLIGNVVDNSHFAALPPEPVRELPTEFFLTVSRLSPEKNISGLLKAFEIYINYGGKWHLCIAGTGPEETALKNIIPQAITHRVHWLGWVDYDRLPGLYQASQCFVLPSHIEPWGLVVNEAMAASKPVLISARCGCLPELCQESVNGHSFRPDNLDELAALMLKVENLPEKTLLQMGRASYQIVDDYSPENWRDKFIRAVREISICN